ncbi:MAG: extracellular solute-binding protein [bacterium]
MKYLRVAVLFSLLFTCSCTSHKGPVRMQVWHQMQPTDRAVLERAVKTWEARHPGASVTVLYKETEELRTTFQTAALAGLGPELIFGPSDQVGPLAIMGFIQPMEPFFTDEELAEFDTACLVHSHGHLFQVADRIGNHLTLIYNKRLLAEPPKDSDELIRVGKELTKDFNGDGRIDQWALVWNYTEPFFFIPFLGGFGGWIMDEEGKPTLNTPEAVAAFEFVKFLRDSARMIPPESDYNSADVLFKEGRAAMLINGPWSWGGYAKAGVDFGLARIPKITKTGLWPSPMVSPVGYSINSNTKGQRLELAVELLKYLLSTEVELEYVKASSVIPSKLSARKDSIFMRNPWMAGAVAQLEVGRLMPIVPELRAIWDAMRPSYQLVLSGTISPALAARRMQNEAVRKIREINE